MVTAWAVGALTPAASVGVGAFVSFRFGGAGRSPVASPGGPLAPREEICLIGWLVEDRHPTKV